MKTESIEKLKSSIINSYRKLGDDKKLIKGFESYSGNQIADEIENETELGIKMIDLLIQLTIDLLNRKKI